MKKADQSKDPFGITATDRRRSGGPLKDRILEKGKAVYEESDAEFETESTESTDSADTES